MLRFAYETIIDALFPLHPAERWLLNMPVDDAVKALPRSKQSSISDSFAVFSYKDERVQRLIWAIKYKKSTKAVKIAATAFMRHLDRFVSMRGSSESTIPTYIVVPMPISTQRRRERGFNQCELIIDAMQGHIRDMNTSCSFEKNLLIRAKHTSRQTLKDKAGRQEIHDLFAVDEKTAARLKDGSKRSQLTIIVIDDVVTTGATMKTAVSSLRAAGFDAWGLSVAH